jgi:hypothetical protein
MKKRIISLAQPWASGIFEYGVNVINKSWTTKHRGRIYIHATKSFPSQAELFLFNNISGFPIKNRWERGILGYVNLDEITRDSRSGWATSGQYHWVLSDPVKFQKPLECNGMQNLWVPKFDLSEEIDAVLRNELEVELMGG